jgi:hypothetical protein
VHRLVSSSRLELITPNSLADRALRSSHRRDPPRLVFNGGSLVIGRSSVSRTANPAVIWRELFAKDFGEHPLAEIARLDAAHRPDGFVMPACEECNKGTSTADLAVALISRWGDAGTAQEQLDHAKFAKRVLVQAPSLRDEWLSIADDPAESRRAREHLFRHGVNVPASASLATLGPETVGQLKSVRSQGGPCNLFPSFPAGIAGRR